MIPLCPPSNWVAVLIAPLSSSRLSTSMLIFPGLPVPGEMLSAKPKLLASITPLLVTVNRSVSYVYVSAISTVNYGISDIPTRKSSIPLIKIEFSHLLPNYLRFLHYLVFLASIKPPSVKLRLPVEIAIAPASPVPKLLAETRPPLVRRRLPVEMVTPPESPSPSELT